MIELYTAIFLFGIGAYLNKNVNGNEKQAEKLIAKKETTENVYNTKIKEKVDELSEKYAQEMKQKCEKVVPRSFTEFLDPETKKIKDSILLGQKVQIPFFNLKNEVVWGATSMILSEFKKILKGIT